MSEQAGAARPQATSTGHTASGAAWLDVHFTACRPEYEAMLRSVGLQPGWHVLDAGCGGGSFLPLLAAEVGPSGRVTALDLAPENVATVEQQVAVRALPCPVEARVGSLLALPFPDDHFDAAWCANVTQYLTDDELATALAELRRVVRPGGLVAIKEVEAGHNLYGPADPAVVLQHIELALRLYPVGTRGVLRARNMRGWLDSAGLASIWQRTTLIERHAPLSPDERAWYVANFCGFAALFADVDSPEPGLTFWRRQRDPASPDHIVNHPDFFHCEGNVVAVGQVPG